MTRKHLKFLEKLIFIAAFLAVTPILLFAQGDAGVLPDFVDKIPLWVKIAVPALYELLVRVVPTSKNWSILSMVMQLFNWIVPNKSTMKVEVKNTDTGIVKIAQTHDIKAP